MRREEIIGKLLEEVDDMMIELLLDWKQNDVEAMFFDTRELYVILKKLDKII